MGPPAVSRPHTVASPTPRASPVCTAPLSRKRAEVRQTGRSSAPYLPNFGLFAEMGAVSLGGRRAEGLRVAGPTGRVDAMTDEAFDPSQNDLPETGDLPPVAGAPDREELELVEEGNEELSFTDSEVTDEDLSTSDLYANGALPEDLEHGQMGRHEYEADLADPAHEDTIDERVRQEVPEEGFDVVPGSPVDKGVDLSTDPLVADDLLAADDPTRS